MKINKEMDESRKKIMKNPERERERERARERERLEEREDEEKMEIRQGQFTSECCFNFSFSEEDFYF